MAECFSPKVITRQISSLTVLSRCAGSPSQCQKARKTEGILIGKEEITLPYSHKLSKNKMQFKKSKNQQQQK